MSPGPYVTPGLCLTGETYPLVFPLKLVLKSGPPMYPEWTANLRNLYWQLRQLGRVERHRRRIYRHIEAEKKRLEALFFDPEEIRLLCRHLANPRRKRAESTYFAYKARGDFRA